ncbi:MULTISPECIES: carbohydrate ABC transporter permease [unclassified Frondihabitans]|uniref:carbohydrate ABC transporter permease n=1 Tax=unclassified Frondihabitans TaxID=2626248 RepID=UPI000F501088|nr:MULTISPECIES: sugar ABC transporter permease [unclassified Frondihabitans]RPE74283.1 carbohydrate ABC transporter membrane protein 1 (CUT1 family) [Frondihabitans sp. PhB153]RPF02712.1 carbohydrate ABC transporter membrane protein 1 (CUT1 family) [Frondihabitans sp. PhB161]
MSASSTASTLRPGRVDTRQKTPFRIRATTSIAASAFLLPNVLMLALFTLLPLVYAFVISFQSLDSLGWTTWAGFGNYVTMVTDPVFWRSMANTGVFTLFTVPVGMAIGLAIAVLLNGVLPGRTVFRSIIFLPLVVSGVATGVLGAWMFDQNNGFIDKMLQAIGLPSIDWQSNGAWALTAIILVTLWQRVGFDMLIYLAGLQGVDPGVQEAARVDGASAWQSFRYITLPLLGPSTFFLLIMNLIYSFQVFDTVWAMTRGGPGYSTTTIVSYAYRLAFDESGPSLLGYGAAVGVAIYLITLAITAIQWRANTRRERAEQGI